MTRAELPELHFIAPIDNLASIMAQGILCHERAKKVGHRSVAMEEIQERRRKVIVPGGRRLHEYTNLYINARNKMMFKLKAELGDAGLAVLSISTDVLDLPDVVIADSNASSGYVRFAPAPGGLALIDRDQVFAVRWTHTDQRDTWAHGSIVCAEVLVPGVVPPRYITRAYASCAQSCTVIKETVANLPVTVNARLFFR